MHKMHIDYKYIVVVLIQDLHYYIVQFLSQNWIWELKEHPQFFHSQNFQTYLYAIYLQKEFLNYQNATFLTQINADKTFFLSQNKQFLLDLYFHLNGCFRKLILLLLLTQMLNSIQLILYLQIYQLSVISLFQVILLLPALLQEMKWVEEKQQMLKNILFIVFVLWLVIYYQQLLQFTLCKIKSLKLLLLIIMQRRNQLIFLDYFCLYIAWILFNVISLLL
ncbi:hypothetical protein IMG5_007650 [Ichthyophthirius multifiliis]|uniref:Transmembrane protein n=1 Tax=Ichthyophthirius multifiliis TaxID=5932 RepID=G0QJQ5_ICHMU|nr:hypothetical protein IMG5_007650 [Ichthyophthirius multifiliis]EGR34553.1 hypothetical protein IMG5_007650 [Ichthyophthirius multifiliis]|eukprot:XP_004039857.1 hypothetical protein IMG5_007650 [Ichthyophthirius multifiliis]